MLSNKFTIGIFYLIFGCLFWLCQKSLPAWSVILVFGAGVFLTIKFFYPEYILGLIILSVPLEIERDIIYSFTVYTTEWFLLLAVLVWIWQIVYNKRKLILPPKTLSLSIIVFFLALFASFINGQSILASIKQTVKWLQIFVVYLFFINFLDAAPKKSFIINLFLITGTLLGIYVVSRSIMLGISFHSSMGMPFFSQTNALASYLGLFVPLSLSMVMQSNKIKKRIIYGLSFLILFTALLFTFSRGGWVGFIVSFIVLFLILNKKKKIILLTFLIVLAIGFLVFPGSPVKLISTRFKSITQIHTDTTIQYRISFLKTGIEMFKEHPLFGNGVGNYHFFLTKYNPDVREDMKCHLHNLYLQILVEAGLFGLISFLWLIFAHMKFIFTKLKKIENDYQYSIHLGCFASSIAFLTHNLFDVLTVHSFGLLWGLLIAVGISDEYNKESR